MYVLEIFYRKYSTGNITCFLLDKFQQMWQFYECSKSQFFKILSQFSSIHNNFFFLKFGLRRENLHSERFKWFHNFEFGPDILADIDSTYEHYWCIGLNRSDPSSVLEMTRYFFLLTIAFGALFQIVFFPNFNSLYINRRFLVP